MASCRFNGLFVVPSGSGGARSRTFVAKTTTKKAKPI